MQGSIIINKVLLMRITIIEHKNLSFNGIIYKNPILQCFATKKSKSTYKNSKLRKCVINFKFK